jgi:PAS domain S-box-containing protein
MDFSLLLNKVQILTLWPNNMVLAGCLLLLLWLYVRCVLPSSAACSAAGIDCDVKTDPENQDISCEDEVCFSLELLSVFQVISSILDHDSVQVKLIGDVFVPLVQNVLREMKSVGVQGISITVNQELFAAGICSGNGWHLERDVLGDSLEKGVLQFYGVLPDHECPANQQKVCLKIADYLAGRLSRFLFFKKSMQEVALFRHLIDQATEIILIIDPLSGKILDVNARACIELGYAPHELAGKRLGMILDAGQDDFFIENESEKYGHEMFMETKFVRNDQTIFPVEMSLKNVDLADQKYQLAMARDLSARNEMIHQKMDMERQLIQSEKMASVGQLSAGIAHEINNPISFITSNLGVMQEYVQDVSRLLTEYRNFVRMVDIENDFLREKHLALTALEDEIEGGYLLKDLKDVVAESLEGADRIKRIVQDMKSFAHPGEDKLKATDINKGLESTLNIAWNELKYKAEVVKDFGELSPVMCFPQQINQVFMNIIVNAGQAIEQKGEITISTFQRKDIVHIAIADTGHGMEAEVVEHIFEPFFTTKEVGKGTGLGLNVAYNIIRKHEGYINVDSSVGKGTTFTITLPVQGPKEKKYGV